MVSVPARLDGRVGDRYEFRGGRDKRFVWGTISAIDINEVIVFKDEDGDWVVREDDLLRGKTDIAVEDNARDAFAAAERYMKNQ